MPSTGDYCRVVSDTHGFPVCSFTPGREAIPLQIKKKVLVIFIWSFELCLSKALLMFPKILIT